jgi:hypothetical protein
MLNIELRYKTNYKKPISVTNRVWQGDALACLLFNIILEKVIRDAAVNTRGIIFYKSVQILAYADNIDIIGRTQSAMFEAFTTFKKATKGMNLFINQDQIYARN